MAIVVNSGYQSADSDTRKGCFSFIFPACMCEILLLKSTLKPNSNIGACQRDFSFTTRQEVSASFHHTPCHCRRPLVSVHRMLAGH